MLRVLFPVQNFNFELGKVPIFHRSQISLGSCELPQKCWARSVQPFLHLLDTNKQTNRQANYNTSSQSFYFLTINLPWGHVRSHTKFGSDRFNRFDVFYYGVLYKRTDKQTNRQTDKQSIYLYIDTLLVCPFVSGFYPINSIKG